MACRFGEYSYKVLQLYFAPSSSFDLQASPSDNLKPLAFYGDNDFEKWISRATDSFVQVVENDDKPQVSVFTTVCAQNRKYHLVCEAFLQVRSVHK